MFVIVIEFYQHFSLKGSLFFGRGGFKVNDKEIQSMIRQSSSLNDELLSNITNELNPKYCTGCSACAQVCPKKAVTMQTDGEGFLRPQTDKDKCVMCGLCVRKCPQLSPVRENSPSPVCYAVMADDETRMKSSSGGMFSIAASWMLEHGGVVCGAAFDENFQVRHIMVDSIDQLSPLRGSKYIQSRTENIYFQIKEKLSEGIPVLFTGVPCQVAALYSVVGRDNKNLYTIDLVCHGVSSHKVLEKYLHDIHNEKPVRELYFKRKEPWGWGAGTSIFFEDGTKYEQYHYFDPFFIAYNGGYCKNAACSFCSSNTMPRQGDLTMGDFWGIDILDPEMNDFKGTSAVLVNNEKGERFFKELTPHISKYKKQPLSYALAKNSALREQNSLSGYRDVFFEHLDNAAFDMLAYGCKYNRFYDLLAADMEKTVSREDIELYLLAKTASEKCGGRQIVTWVRSPKFEKILRQFFGKRAAFGITTKTDSVRENSIRLFDDISGRSDRYFLVLIQRPNDSFTEKKLLEAGYTEGKDYTARTHPPTVIENYDLSQGPYCDRYGNSVEGGRGITGRIEFSGSNSRIILGNDIKNPENLSVMLGSNGRLEIGSGCRFNKSFKITMSGTSGTCDVRIYDKCSFGSGRMELEADPSGTSVTINERCTFGDELFIESGQGNKIVVGRDCMIGRSVNMVCCKKFSVYDISSGSESAAAAPLKNSIVIGDHTAAGRGCRICRGTEIGSGSVINEYSRTEGSFMNNCFVAGEPAAVIKTDVCWSRKPKGTIDDCQERYRHKTGVLPVTGAGKKVLVICDGGFVGAVLTGELLKHGHDVTLYHINDSRDIFGTSVRHITENKVLKEYFDYVYDTALLPPELLNTLMLSVKCGRYILLSSTLVYPEGHVSHVKEDAFDPINYQPAHDEDPIQTLYRQREKIAFGCAAQNGIDILSVRAPRIVSGREVYLTAIKAAYRAVQTGSLYNIDTPVVFVRHISEFLVSVPDCGLTGAVNFSDKGVISEPLLRKTLYDISNGAVDPSVSDTASHRVFSPVIPDTGKAEAAGFSVRNTEEWLIPMIKYYSDPNLPYDIKYKIPMLI